jgi:hypothetical protein
MEPLLILLVFTFSAFPPSYAMALLWNHVRNIGSGGRLRIIPVLLTVFLLPLMISIPAGSSCGVKNSLAASGGPLPPYVGDVLAVAGITVHWFIIASTLIPTLFRSEKSAVASMWSITFFSEGLLQSRAWKFLLLLMVILLLLSPFIAGLVVGLTATVWLITLMLTVKLYALGEVVGLMGILILAITIIIAVLTKPKTFEWSRPYVKLLGIVGVGLLLIGLSMRFLNTSVNVAMELLGCPDWMWGL